MQGKITLTLAELADSDDVILRGDPAICVRGVGTLQHAEAFEITFLTNPLYRHQLQHTRAAAIILKPEEAEFTSLPCLITRNPHACYARVAQRLFPLAEARGGISPAAWVDVNAKVAATAQIGPHVVVQAGAVIGERVVVEAGCFIGEGVQLSDDVRLYPRVTLYSGTYLGARTVVHSGAVLGADGFGMAWERDHWVKIPQVGRVWVGPDVEIGANTTIDRGAIEDTVVEEGVKLDNQIQIAHNCHIGAHTVIAACTGISGSTRVGRQCRIGGGVGIVGHVEIGDGVTVSGFSLITKSVTSPGVYTSSIPSLPHREWMRTLAYLRHLPDFAERIRALEKAEDELRIKSE